jgi:uroporphyrinogen decarboxylase
MLTSRDRMVAVLEHRRPDRVPLMELWVDGSVVEALLPGGTSNDLAEHIGLDAVTVPTMVYGPDEVEWVDRAAGRFRDKWGALQVLTEEAVPVPTEPPRIETGSDLDAYEPPDPTPSPVLEKVRALKRRYPDGEKAIVVVGESGWAPAVFLRGGLENLLMDLATRPAFVRDLLQIGVDYYRELFRLAIAAGADFVLLGDDYACKTGTLMSPRQWHDVIQPADAAVVAAIKDAGGYCIKHTDGDIRAILDGLVDTGVDCLGPLEPLPGMEMEAILDRYSGRISVMGNLDIDLLSRGMVQDVEHATKKLLATVSSRGAHILSSGNSISSSVRPANFLAMVRTAQEYGRYPIDAGRLGEPGTG